jgi:hypothetical protein
VQVFLKLVVTEDRAGGTDLVLPLREIRRVGLGPVRHALLLEGALIRRGFHLPVGASLVALARKPWQVFTREVLLEQVWGYRHAGDTRLVNVHVQRLRSKIEHDPEHPEIVVTVRGIGYKAGPS